MERPRRSGRHPNPHRPGATARRRNVVFLI